MTTTHSHHSKFNWHNLTRPFSVLAPMDDVTDTAFRRLVLLCGAPDVMVSEFVHVDKLLAGHHEDTRNRLLFHPEEHPLIAQVWGNSPDHTCAAVKTLIDLGYDGIDLNMGCPVSRAIDKGCCSALINNPTLARELFLAARESASDRVPVSIKTRLGFDRLITESWTQFLLTLNPAALTVHGRLATDMYRGAANWDEIGKVVALRNGMRSRTLIIGNGDVQSFSEIQERHDRYGVDGVMAGRAVLKNPFLFARDGRTMESLSPAHRIQLLWHHAELCRQSLGETLGFTVLKKYFKFYVIHFKGAAGLRASLHRAKSIEEAYLYLQPYLQEGPNAALPLHSGTPLNSDSPVY
ncbi:MAG: tRNA-dihydrouridine synthase [Phycisphaerae bacterium]|nr:tRNA-dihydrouridine synthase [Phycisphaerae bacterium]